jgi:hypothetical protein
MVKNLLYLHTVKQLYTIVLQRLGAEIGNVIEVQETIKGGAGNT